MESPWQLPLILKLHLNNSSILMMTYFSTFTSQTFFCPCFLRQASIFVVQRTSKLRGQMTFPRSHSFYVVELGLDLTDPI